MKTLEMFAEAARLGGELPITIAMQLYESADLSASLRMLSPASRREPLLQLFKQWAGRHPGTFAAALLTASIAADQRRRDQISELVWTGPDSNVIPVRQTEQVLLDLIVGAKRSLLVVSYAVFRIPRIRQALVDASSRGVRIRMVLDLATATDIKGYNPLRAVGDDVIACSEILYWPEEQRVVDADGRRGSLHVKCLVADGERMFLSSANLTDQALRLNMELGIIVTGTQHPGNIESHFAELLTRGVLERF